MSQPPKKDKEFCPDNSLGTSSNISKLHSLGRKLKQTIVNANMTMNTPTRTSFVPFHFKTYNANEEICELDQDYKELRAAERAYKRRIISLIDTTKLEIDSRENLI